MFAIHEPIQRNGREQLEPEGLVLLVDYDNNEEPRIIIPISTSETSSESDTGSVLVGVEVTGGMAPPLPPGQTKRTNPHYMNPPPPSSSKPKSRDDKNYKFCSVLCKIVQYTLAMVSIGGIITILWFMLGRPQDLDDLIDGIGALGDWSENVTADFVSGWEHDIQVGKNVGHNGTIDSQWENPKKAGLSLSILNALDDTWQDLFYTSYEDWDRGIPDALKLSTERLPIEYDGCEPVEGVMKVCNGQYGETGWLGINEIVTSVPEGYIQSSVAKMNEFYLIDASETEKQYTICHEMGHGFGLAHTDENFYNPDLGNCLDYTSSPENNQHPGTINYDTLARVYGVLDPEVANAGAAFDNDLSDTTNNYKEDGELDDGNVQNGQNNNNKNDDKNDNKNKNNRKRTRVRTLKGENSIRGSKATILKNKPDAEPTKSMEHIQKEYHEAMRELEELHKSNMKMMQEKSNLNENDRRKLLTTQRSGDWRVVEWSTHGSKYEKYLTTAENDSSSPIDASSANMNRLYKVHVQMLHAPSI